MILQISRQQVQDTGEVTGEDTPWWTRIQDTCNGHFFSNNKYIR
jgi:hypothetical protein